MIKIIKEGSKTFYKTCPMCGCCFSYEGEDIYIDCESMEYKVTCPQCKTKVKHIVQTVRVQADGTVTNLPYTVETVLLGG